MEPFEQDFGYLADAVSYTFEMIRSGLYPMPLNDADRVTWSLRAIVVADTYAHRSSVGQHPQDRYNEALEDRGRFDPPMFNMDRWVDLYLLDVRAIAIRLGGSGMDEVGKRLDELRTHIAQPPTGEWHATELALVAGAKQRLQVGIDAVKQAMIAAANTSTTATAKAPKRKGAAPPEVPTLASKFAAVPGSLEKFMALLRSEGIVDEQGRFLMAHDEAGKGKLIAAWTAAREVFALVAFARNVQLVKALIDHIPDLTGLDRVDKVVKGKKFSGFVGRYKEDLQDD